MSFRKDEPEAESRAAFSVKCSSCGGVVLVVDAEGERPRRCKCQDEALAWIREVMGLAVGEEVPRPPHPAWSYAARAAMIPGAWRVPGYEVRKRLELEDWAKAHPGEAAAAAPGPAAPDPGIPPDSQVPDPLPGSIQEALANDLEKIVRPGPGIELSGIEIRGSDGKVVASMGDLPDRDEATADPVSAAPDQGEPGDPPEPVDSKDS